MKHTFGQLDLDAAKTRRAPIFQAILKEPVWPVCLRNAIRNTLPSFPVFTAHFVGKNAGKALLAEGNLTKDHRAAFLETAPLPEPTLWHASLDNRPVLADFAKDNNNVNYYNDALYQFCWYENYITFEWLPLLTDTPVALSFFSAVLDAYCEFCKKGKLSANVSLNFAEDDSIFTAEAVYDPEAKSVGQVPQCAGYKREDVPVLPDFTCHVLHFNVKDILKVSRKDSDSVMTVLAAALARTIAREKNCDCENANANDFAVTTAFYADARTALDLETSHVATYRKTIAYEPRMERYPLEQLSTVYRHALSVFLEKENLQSYIPADSSANLDAEHAGTLNLSSHVAKKLVDFRMMELPKTADAMLSSVLNGKKLVVCLTERFRQPVFNDFVALCRSEGLPPENTENFILE